MARVSVLKVNCLSQKIGIQLKKHLEISFSTINRRYLSASKIITEITFETEEVDDLSVNHGKINGGVVGYDHA